MEPFFETYDELLGNLIERIDGIFSDLPMEALDWTPDPALNTLTVLVVHSMGALRYWTVQMLGGKDVDRDREAEFDAHGMSKSDLHDLLKETRSQVSAALEGLTMEDLDGKQYSSLHKDYFTGRFALAHALEHTALHVGHMEITRELWEQFDWDRK